MLEPPLDLLDLSSKLHSDWHWQLLSSLWSRWSPVTPVTPSDTFTNSDTAPDDDNKHEQCVPPPIDKLDEKHWLLLLIVTWFIKLIVSNLDLIVSICSSKQYKNLYASIISLFYINVYFKLLPRYDTQEINKSSIFKLTQCVSFHWLWTFYFTLFIGIIYCVRCDYYWQLCSYLDQFGINVALIAVAVCCVFWWLWETKIVSGHVSW